MPTEPGDKTDTHNTLAAHARFVAHALGNPLAALSLSLEMLEQTPLQATQQRYVGRCRQACDRLLGEQALLSAQGRGTKGACEWVDVATLAHAGFAHVHRAVGPGDGASGRTALAVGEGAQRVWAARPLLQEALQVLLANAAEAAGERGAVGIQSERRGSQIVLQVWDDGPGVCPAQRQDLFVRRTTTKPRGVGLGLLRVVALVKDAQGGGVSHAARRPQGAVFSLFLPLPREPAGAHT